MIKSYNSKKNKNQLQFTLDDRNEFVIFMKKLSKVVPEYKLKTNKSGLCWNIICYVDLCFPHLNILQYSNYIKNKEKLKRIEKEDE